jgi:hypothetical protein
MLTRAAGVLRHRAVRVVAVLVVVAYPFWANPARVNADPSGWRPAFTANFNKPAEFFAVCTKADGATDGGNRRPAAARIAGDQLLLDVTRNGSSYDLGGVDCDKLPQLYGRYEVQVETLAVAGVSLVIELHGTNPDDTSRVRVGTVPGAVKLHIVNGSTKPVDVRQDIDSPAPRVIIEWTPAGFYVLVDRRTVFHDPIPSTAYRVLSVATAAVDAVSGQPDANAALPASFRVNALLVSAYDPAESASPPVAPVPERHGGPSWWLIGAVAVAALVLTLIVIAVKRRDPRKLRPGHRA